MAPGRLRKHWGWGFEDEQPSVDELRAMAGGVRDLLGLPTEIVGVVASGAPATARSFAAGHAVSTDSADTFVDGVACRVPDPDAIAVIVEGGGDRGLEATGGSLAAPIARAVMQVVLQGAG